MRVSGLAFFVLALAAFSNPASAGCRAGADPDNPMLTDEDYGIARCRGAVSAEDPMVWSTDQWRSDLFPDYATTSDDGYDRRPRRAADEPMVRINVKIEKHVEMMAPQAATTVTAPVRPKLIGWREMEPKAGRGVLRFNGHGCKGVLVLTWSNLGSRAKCHTAGGRATRIF